MTRDFNSFIDLMKGRQKSSSGHGSDTDSLASYASSTATMTPSASVRSLDSAPSSAGGSHVASSVPRKSKLTKDRRGLPHEAQRAPTSSEASSSARAVRAAPTQTAFNSYSDHDNATSSYQAVVFDAVLNGIHRDDDRSHYSEGFVSVHREASDGSQTYNHGHRNNSATSRGAASSPHDPAHSRHTSSRGNRRHVYLAVMGITGSGKSRFIRNVTGKDVLVGDKLESCTSRVEAFTCWIGDVCLTLIDTPGFDDTHKSEIEVLEIIANFLDHEYQSGMRLNGIIYTHPIVLKRMGGASKRNLEMFRKLCGDDCLQNVTLVTTMWDELLRQPGGEACGQEREDELLMTRAFWGAMRAAGARTLRYDGSRERAIQIVQDMLEQEKMDLDIQKEMDQGITIAETKAGQKVIDMNHKAIREMQDQVTEAKKEIAAQNERVKRQLQQAENQRATAEREKEEALQNIEHIRKAQQSSSMSDADKAELEKLRRQVNAQAHMASQKAEKAEQNISNIVETAEEEKKDIVEHIQTVNQGIKARQDAETRIQESNESRRSYWLLGAAASIAPVLEGFAVAGPIGALVAGGVCAAYYGLSGWALF